MDAHMVMDSDASGCTTSMLWNWNTIHTCFLSSSWHIHDGGMFAASCLGVIALVIWLEGMRRISKEYDSLVHRQWTTHAYRQSKKFTESSLDITTFAFRASPIQQLIRAILHACTFGLGYLVMLLAMSFNGYIVICIIIGAGLGRFFLDWATVTINLDPTIRSNSHFKQPALPCL